MIKPNDKVYFARALNGEFICDALTVHRVVDNEKYHYFTAIEPMVKRGDVVTGTGMTFLFELDDIGKFVFLDRGECNEYLEELERKYGY